MLFKIVTKVNYKMPKPQIVFHKKKLTAGLQLYVVLVHCSTDCLYVRPDISSALDQANQLQK